MSEIIGKVHGPDVLFFRMEAGTAKGDDGVVYELSTGVGGGTPIVQNTKTGRWFTLNWQDILTLAKRAGIDEPVKKAKAVRS